LRWFAISQLIKTTNKRSKQIGSRWANLKEQGHNGGCIAFTAVSGAGESMFLG
jgi:hypothetical protein